MPSIIDSLDLSKRNIPITAKKLLYAHVLLDRSGSMEIVRDATIDAFNEYVHGLTVDPNLDARVSLSLFDSYPAHDVQVELIFDRKPAAEFPKLTKDLYIPRGGTPLNDAIGQTAARIDSETRLPDEGTAFVILTDGMENASKEYSQAAIKALLEDRQKNRNWLVIYLAANVDAFQEGVAKRGTMAGHSMNFSGANVSASLAAASRSSRSYGISGQNTSADVDFTDAERKAAK